MIDIGHISTRNLHFYSSNNNNSSNSNNVDGAIEEVECASNSKRYVLTRMEHKVDILDLEQLYSHEVNHDVYNRKNNKYNNNNNNRNNAHKLMLSIPFPHRRLTSCSLVALPWREQEQQHHMHHTTRKTRRNENVKSSIHKHSNINCDVDDHQYIDTHIRRVPSHKSHSSPHAEVLLAVGDDQSTLRISRHSFMTNELSHNNATQSLSSSTTSHAVRDPIRTIFIGNSWDGLDVNWLRNRQREIKNYEESQNEQSEEKEEEKKEEEQEINQWYAKKNLLYYHNPITTLFPATNDGSFFVCQREWEDYTYSNSNTNNTTLSDKTQEKHHTSPIVWVASVEAETARRVELEILPPSSSPLQSSRNETVTQGLTNNHNGVTQRECVSNTYWSKELHNGGKVKLIDVRCMTYTEWTNNTRWNNEMSKTEARNSLFCKQHSDCTLEKVSYKIDNSSSRCFVAVYSDWFTLHDSLSCKPLVSFPLKNCQMTEINFEESSTSITTKTNAAAANLDHPCEWKIIDVFQCRENHETELRCCHPDNTHSGNEENKTEQSEESNRKEDEDVESNISNNNTNRFNTINNNEHELIVVFGEQKKHDKMGRTKSINVKLYKQELQEHLEEQEEENRPNYKHQEQRDGKRVNDVTCEEEWEPQVCIAGYDTRVPTGPVWYSICNAKENNNNNQLNRKKFSESNDNDTNNYTNEKNESINGVNVHNGKCHNERDYTNASNLVESLDPRSLCVVHRQLTRNSVVQTLRVPWCKSQQVVLPMVLSAQSLFAQENDTYGKREEVTSNDAPKMIRALVNYKNILHVITTHVDL